MLLLGGAPGGSLQQLPLGVATGERVTPGCRPLGVVPWVGGVAPVLTSALGGGRAATRVPPGEEVEVKVERVLRAGQRHRLRRKREQGQCGHAPHSRRE